MAWRKHCGPAHRIINAGMQDLVMLIVVVTEHEA